MMQESDTVLVAAVLATPLGFLWEVWGYPRFKAWKDAPSECHHVFERDGDPHTRTDKCVKCRHQQPVKCRRCPKCRQWSDEDEV